jgi:pyruvate/2-oxoglutarate dehydrogenase complex dihydrolipoamide dehydrogenase (E3) component
MSERPFALIVGGGTAGTHAARALARAGKQVVLAEPGKLGGTCLWRGCVPKKALFDAARAWRRVAATGRLGILAKAPQLDWQRLRLWQRDVQQTYAGDQEGILRELGVDVVRARARFTGAGRLKAGKRSFQPENILVATGARPVVPDVRGADLFEISDDALFYDELPSSLLVVGGGLVAMEMAGIYASFGTNVTLAVRGERVLDGFDAEVAEVALEGLRGLGVDVRFSTSVTELRGQTDAVAAQLDGERPETLVVQHALAATGRRAHLDGLDLEAGDIPLGDEGKPVLDGDLRSVGESPVWFAGDAVGGPMATPIAGLEGDRVAAAMLDIVERPLLLDLVPRACFTVPEIAKVGAGEGDLSAERRPYVVARSDFENAAEPIIRAERRGFVKLVAAPHGQVLGGQVASADASELIHTLAVAIRGGVTLAELARSRAVHPTMEEAIVSAARSAPQIEAESLRLAS